MNATRVRCTLVPRNRRRAYVYGVGPTRDDAEIDALRRCGNMFDIAIVRFEVCEAGWVEQPNGGVTCYTRSAR